MRRSPLTCVASGLLLVLAGCSMPRGTTHPSPSSRTKVPVVLAALASGESFAVAEREARREGKGLWRKGEPPIVSEEAVSRFAGEIVTVGMTCSGVEKRKKFGVLKSAAGGFEILIPSEVKPAFPDPAALQGRKIVVTGFVETFNGRVQILVFLSRQMKTVEGRLPLRKLPSH